MTTRRASAEPTGPYTVVSQTASVAKSSNHRDTQRQKPKGLPGPDQLKSQVHQKQNFHLTSSGACQSWTIHTNGTGGTIAKQAIATTKKHKCSMPTFSAHSNTKGNIIMTPAPDLSISETHQRCPNIMD